LTPPARATSGTGIGLAILRAIVEAHGGTVMATSGGLGRGTTFAVTLPIPGSCGRHEPGSPQPLVITHASLEGAHDVPAVAHLVSDALAVALSASRVSFVISRVAIGIGDTSRSPPESANPRDRTHTGA
jgi:hypothetical protein